MLKYGILKWYPFLEYGRSDIALYTEWETFKIFLSKKEKKTSQTMSNLRIKKKVHIRSVHAYTLIDTVFLKIFKHLGC